MTDRSLTDTEISVLVEGYIRGERPQRPYDIGLFMWKYLPDDAPSNCAAMFNDIPSGRREVAKISLANYRGEWKGRDYYT